MSDRIVEGPITRQVVFVDLDSTLCNTYHRSHLINWDDIPATDWKTYALACADDTPFYAVLKVVYDLASLYRIVVISGRDEVANDLTKAWLRRYSVPYDELILRPDGNDEHNGPYKVNRIKEWLAANPDSRLRLLIDDWPAVVELAEAEGWDVLLVNPNYPQSIEDRSSRPLRGEVVF